MADFEQGVSEEEVQHNAAVTIQRQWRRFWKDQVQANATAEGGASPDGAVDGRGSDGGHMSADGVPSGSPHRDLTEEEQRDILMDRVRQSMSDREALLQNNLTLQRTLAKIFADRRAGQDSSSPAAGGSEGAEGETRYWSQLQRLRDERNQVRRLRKDQEQELELSRQSHEHILQEATQHEHNFQEFVKERALEAVFARSSKKITVKQLEEFEAAEASLASRVHQVRVAYIQLRNKVKKLSPDSGSHSKDSKREGMHLIDFEQLKIENTNLNEKIEERNEDLLKLRKKATTTIHVLTHVKEKLEFVKTENTTLQKQVGQMEEELASLRDGLATSKRERDLFSNENLKIKEKMPMIGSEDLLLDYEVRKKEIENCRIEVVELTNRHHELMQWIATHQSLVDTMRKSVA